MFESQMDDSDDGEVSGMRELRMDMSEAATRAFYLFIYFMEIRVPREDSSVALELLKAGGK